MKLNFKIFAMGMLCAAFNIIGAPSALDIVNVVAMAKGISTDPSAAAAAAAAAKAAAAAAAAVKSGAPVTPAPYPTGNIFATPLQLSAGQTLTELNYYIGFMGNLITAFMFNSSGDTANFLAAVNASIAQGNTVVFTGSATPSGTGYDAVVSAYNSSNQTTPIASYPFPSITNWVMNSGLTNHINTNVTMLNANNSIQNRWVKYVTATPTVSSGYILINPSTGYQIQSAAPAAAAAAPAVALTAPYVQGTNYIQTPALGGAPVSSFIYSPVFADGSYTELFITPANLALIPAGISVVFIGNVGRTSTTAAGCYDAVICAYPAGSTATTAPIFTQLFPSIVKYTGDAAADITTTHVSDTDKWTATDIVYNGAVSVISGYGVEISTAAAAVAVTPAPYPTGNIFATPLQLSAGQTLTELNYYIGFSDNLVTAFMFNSSGDTANFLTAVNASIAQGNTVVFTGSATPSGTGYDAVVSAYNSSNQTTPIASYPFPSITNWSSSASGHTNTHVAIPNANNPITNRWVKYVTANPPSSSSGYKLINPSTGYQIQSVAAAAAVALPTNIYNPSALTPPLSFPFIPEGQTLSSFDVSPNFSDNTYSQMMVSDSNIQLLNNHLATISDQDVLFGLTLANNSSGWSGSITAFDNAKAVIFTQEFPSLMSYTGFTASSTAISAKATQSNNVVVYSFGGSAPYSLGGSIGLSDGFGFGLIPAPYPTVVYGAPVSLPAGTTISSFNFLPVIGGNANSVLSVLPANLALIPANSSVVFTLDVVNNLSKGYDAFVSAYTPGTATPIFTQGYTSIVVYSGNTPTSTVFSDVYPWNDTTFSYTLSNGTTTISTPIDLNPGSITSSSNKVKAVSFTAAAA